MNLLHKKGQLQHDIESHKIEYYVAVSEKGLWPNLKQLNKNSLGAFFYNKPSHGFGCGDIELYISNDKGKTWEFRSQVSDHSDRPEQVRMNHAVGIDADGNIVAVISGWSKEREAPALDLQICISNDSGVSWNRTLWQIPSESSFVPYGDIVCDRNGNLMVGLHSKTSLEGKSNFFTSVSSDGGRNWSNPLFVAAEHGEVTLLQHSSGKLFSLGRSVSRKVSYVNLDAAADHLVLFESLNGTEWEKKCNITIPGQFPGHLLEMHNGQLLMTYGCRISGFCGVQAMISCDKGESWSHPITLVSFDGPTDCGYPSTVQLTNDTLVTAYYAKSTPFHNKYHMGICRWKKKRYSC